ncbi:dTDP-4-dehydrorhamnose reductase (plasmid) [Pseudoseohaeicola sp. NH-UV-7]|uniref:dTDP-4-dehydrorhamnose reductase n=1 Tax=unclassified Sulfitobacter TaxID=196795 RepID=UPI000E0AB085|nr:dTDP-4-dehydrorhamnose reductase [Sulfitobacter sp. JL08]AXI54332.1 dTDP-4-dehydrorhamnose reductase [Sulfitobacter sp. JL08]
MILVFGKTGQVASELAKFDDIKTLGRDPADLSDPAACADAITACAPAAVINAAAYTAVDAAEENEALASVINGDAPGTMARTCATLNIPFVTISTDYVFSGTGSAPWKPSDPVGPLGAYGRSKLAGERAVLDAGGSAAILRTSWVFSAHGLNFVKTMLRLGAERDALNIVADQIGGPTAAGDIAAACVTIARALIDTPRAPALYHYAGTPDVSWADFARTIFDMAGIDCTVTDIPSSAYPTPAMRPKNSRLDCRALTRTFGIERPDWRVSLRAVLSELQAI